MSKAEIDSFLAGRLVCRVATVNDDGSPHVTPVWYYWDGDCLFILFSSQRRSVKNLKRDKRCCVVIDHDERPVLGVRKNRAIGVLMKGSAEIFEDLQQKVKMREGSKITEYTLSDLIPLVGKRYMVSSQDQQAIREMMSRAQKEHDYHPLLKKEASIPRALAKIHPHKILAWDFSKAPFED